jgi:hypothetical protein
MQRSIPVRVHMSSEPGLFLLLLLLPFIAGYSDVDAARNVSIAAAIVVLVATLTTDWPLSVVRVLPLRLHGLLDVGLGVLLILAPFLAGFSDDSTLATIIDIVLGVGFIAAGLTTNWGGAHPRPAARRGAATR